MNRLKVMVPALAVAMAGCVSTYDPYYYDYTYDDPYWYGYDSYYVYSWVDPYGLYYFSAPSTQTLDVNAAAQAIADRANTSTYFSPAGCAGAVASGATVTYDL